MTQRAFAIAPQSLTIPVIAPADRVEGKEYPSVRIEFSLNPHDASKMRLRMVFNDPGYRDGQPGEPAFEQEFDGNGFPTGPTRYVPRNQPPWLHTTPEQQNADSDRQVAAQAEKDAKLMADDNSAAEQVKANGKRKGGKDQAAGADTTG